MSDELMDAIYTVFTRFLGWDIRVRCTNIFQTLVYRESLAIRSYFIGK